MFMGRIQHLRMSILWNLIYRFIAIPIKIPKKYFVNIDKQILKFIWRDKSPKIANTILKVSKGEGLTLLNFMTYTKL